MDINKEINKLITTIQTSLQVKLKERNDYIHTLKWEHHQQLEKYRDENKQLKAQIAEYKKQFKLFGESHNLTGEQQARLEHGKLPYS
jgi:cell division protein FtsB